mmetsp:Transcript_21821/g.24376  ORF Transcript_21821/g.24376 Transcript_21821/m.24376 type:complete len:266 (-) Transcript_21821:156-953(-)
MNILIRPSSCIFLLLLLLKSPLKGEGEDDDLFVKRWEISDPRATICEEGTCTDPSSSIRLEYTIHKQAKDAKFRIFKKDCEEEFDDGTEPVRGTTPSSKEIVNKDIDPFTAMSLSPNEDDDSTTASVEFSPVIASLSLWSSWWKDAKKKILDDDDGRTKEFCIRMSLWTSSKSDAMEVNFRETVVAVTYYDTKDKDNMTKEKDDDVSPSDDTNIQKLEFGIESVMLFPRPLRGVEVQMVGMGASNTVGKKSKNGHHSDSIQNDEL